MASALGDAFLLLFTWLRLWDTPFCIYLSGFGSGRCIFVAICKASVLADAFLQHLRNLGFGRRHFVLEDAMFAFEDVMFFV